MDKKKLPRFIACGDYDALLHHAVDVGDKEWFEDLIKKKKELQALEEEMRRELGVIE